MAPKNKTAIVKAPLPAAAGRAPVPPPELLKLREIWQRFKKNNRLKARKEVEDYLRENDSPLARYCKAKMLFAEAQDKTAATGTQERERDDNTAVATILGDIETLLRPDVCSDAQHRPLLSACLLCQALICKAELTHDWDDAVKVLEVGIFSCILPWPLNCPVLPARACRPDAASIVPLGLAMFCLLLLNTRAG